MGFHLTGVGDVTGVGDDDVLTRNITISYTPIIGLLRRGLGLLDDPARDHPWPGRELLRQLDRRGLPIEARREVAPDCLWWRFGDRTTVGLFGVRRVP